MNIATLMRPHQRFNEGMYGDPDVVACAQVRVLECCHFSFDDLDSDSRHGCQSCFILSRESRGKPSALSALLVLIWNRAVRVPGCISKYIGVNPLS